MNKDQNPLLSYLNTIQAQPKDNGESTGVSDDIPAMLSEGEYVVNAEQVSKLGGGATDPGLRFLEEVFALVNNMDRETAVAFAENILMTGELLLEEQPEITEE
jgi:hypothetical protein